MTGIHRSRAIVRERVPAGNGRGAPSAQAEVSGVHTPDVRSDRWILGDTLRLIGSDPPVDLVIRSALDALRGVEGCRAALAYLWDPGAETLSLAGTAPLGQRVGDERYRLGDEVIGRAALSTDGVVTGSLAIVGPPRGKARLASIATRATVTATRIESHDELFGVLAVVPVERPSTGATRALTEAAELLAIALARGRMRSVERRHTDLLGCIEILARSAAAEASLAETLAAIAALGLRVTRGNACAVYVSDRSQRELRLAAVAPRGSGVPDVWRQRDDVPGACLVARTAFVGAERAASVVVFADSRRPTQDDVAVCERLASVVAVAIRQRRLLDASVERVRVDELLWDIVGASGRADPAAVLARAQRAGCDLSDTRVVVVGTSPTGEKAARLRSAIIAADPTAIADVSGDHVVAIVTPGALAKLPADAWSIGVSQACDDLALYARAYRQAWDTLDLGTRLFGPARLVRFEDLGSYRFVPALVQAGLRSEAEYHQVSKLSDELLRTLEAYLDSGGNTALAAKQLYLHRNTLRQRLERISTILEMDVSRPDRWLALQLAIKTARMSRLDSVRARPPDRP